MDESTDPPGIDVRRDGPRMTVTFDRPHRRNAMTWAMYDALAEACERADSDRGVRVLVLRGAGGDFVAGTDISEFREVRTGEDGVAYESRIDDVLGRLAGVDVPTVAAISGYCLGGGLAIAAACDLRVAASDARFGVPVARTLGNCLSVRTHALLADTWGTSATVDLLLRARLLDAERAHTLGFVGDLAPTDGLDELVDSVVEGLVSHAPLTMWATKEAVRRLRAAGPGTPVTILTAQ